MQEEYFDRQVNKLPETVECRYQNVPMKLLPELKSMKYIQVANNTKETIGNKKVATYFFMEIIFAICEQIVFYVFHRNV